MNKEEFERLIMARDVSKGRIYVIELKMKELEAKIEGNTEQLEWFIPNTHVYHRQVAHISINKYLLNHLDGQLMREEMLLRDINLQIETAIVD